MDRVETTRIVTVSFLKQLLFLLLVAFTVAFFAFGWDGQSQEKHDITSPKKCNIKGNIDLKTGKRTYYLPGQRLYGRVGITRNYGERWFCSEAEALAAGWVPSNR